MNYSDMILCKIFVPYILLSVFFFSLFFISILFFWDFFCWGGGAFWYKEGQLFLTSCLFPINDEPFQNGVYS